MAVKSLTWEEGLLSPVKNTLRRSGKEKRKGIHLIVAPEGGLVEGGAAAGGLALVHVGAGRDLLGGEEGAVHRVLTTKNYINMKKREREKGKKKRKGKGKERGKK